MEQEEFQQLVLGEFKKIREIQHLELNHLLQLDKTVFRLTEAIEKLAEKTKWNN